MHKKPDIDFTLLKDRQLNAAVKYHRQMSEYILQQIYNELRKIEKGEIDTDVNLLKLLDEHLTHTNTFITAWRVRQARKMATT